MKLGPAYSCTVRLALWMVLSAIWLPGCAKEDKPVGPQVIELDLRATLHDGSERDAFSAPEPSLYNALTQIWKATESNDVRGIFLRVGPMLGAWGRATDLAEALNSFRATDRFVHCNFEMTDNTGYRLMASSCDRITMTPSGTLDLIGPALVMFYANSFLKTVGLEAQIVHVGRFKGAGDMFIRDEMPAEARESLNAVLNDVYEAIVTAVATRTNGEEDAARALIDAGPYVGEDALKGALVDALEFDDQARDKAREQGDVKEVTKRRLLPKAADVSLFDVLDTLGGGEKAHEARGERIALVNVVGDITEGATSSSGDAVSGPFVKAMRRLAKDDKVKAVVMRINSPGGSALASDRMWQAAREVAAKKPLIASVGDMAASGGYYIASSADMVFAHPQSLVGSIGVVGGKISLGPLAKRLGITPVVLQRGKHAAWSTLVQPMSQAELDAFQRMLNDTYERFISRVSTGRKLAREQVLAAAEGRVMSGKEGKRLGLVDELGGLGQAMATAREKAGVPASIAVEVWPPEEGVLEAISKVLGTEEDAMLRQLSSELSLLGIPASQAAAYARLAIQREHIALLPPMVFGIR